MKNILLGLVIALAGIACSSPRYIAEHEKNIKQKIKQSAKVYLLCSVQKSNADLLADIPIKKIYGIAIVPRGNIRTCDTVFLKRLSVSKYLKKSSAFLPYENGKLDSIGYFMAALPSIKELSISQGYSTSKRDKPVKPQLNWKQFSQVQALRITNNHRYVPISIDWSPFANVERLTWDLSYDTVVVDTLFLPMQIENLEKLKELTLSSDNYKRLSSARKMFALPNLSTLSVKKFELAAIASYFNLAQLESLILRETGIETIPSNVCQLDQLKTLVIEDAISEIPAKITGLKQLGYLNVSGSTLEKLPEEIRQLENIKTISLSKNKFTAFPQVLLGQKNIRRIYLNDNQITSLPEALKRQKHLRELHLKGNPIPLEEIEALKKALPWTYISFKEGLKRL